MQDNTAAQHGKDDGSTTWTWDGRKVARRKDGKKEGEKEGQKEVHSGCETYLDSDDGGWRNETGRLAARSAADEGRETGHKRL